MRLGRRRAANEGSTVSPETIAPEQENARQKRAPKPWAIFAFDGHSYKRVKVLNARSADDALDKFTEPWTKGGNETEMPTALMVVPERYTKLRKPEVTRKTSVSYAEVDERTVARSTEAPAED